MLATKKIKNSSIEMYCFNNNKITSGSSTLSHIIKSIKYNRKNLLAMISDFLPEKN